MNAYTRMFASTSLNGVLHLRRRERRGDVVHVRQSTPTQIDRLGVVRGGLARLVHAGKAPSSLTLSMGMSRQRLQQHTLVPLLAGPAKLLRRCRWPSYHLQVLRVFSRWLSPALPSFIPRCISAQRSSPHG